MQPASTGTSLFLSSNLPTTTATAVFALSFGQKCIVLFFLMLHAVYNVRRPISVPVFLSMQTHKVLELGCGHGLPGVMCLMAGAEVHFQVSSQMRWCVRQ